MNNLFDTTNLHLIFGLSVPDNPIIEIPYFENSYVPAPMTDELREEIRHRMLTANPMKNPETAKKAIATRTARGFMPHNKGKSKFAVIFNCEECGTEHLGSKNRRRFCDKSCAASHRNRRRKR